ncbi:hypothetical protein [Kineococcus xinjiangensis]|uniref:hypothetical protein n=1 Tax=Kineococcus xinjiangensis TaxID=512762 RepID=UPI001304EF53|nr:hypothetical protein [Kineococcus xinjiangensis]
MALLEALFWVALVCAVPGALHALLTRARRPKALRGSAALRADGGAGYYGRRSVHGGWGTYDVAGLEVMTGAGGPALADGGSCGGGDGGGC